MTRTINGLVFHVHSPSLFELKSVRDDIGDGHRVFIRYSGFKWWVDYAMPGREPLRRPFASRDDAISLIASRAA